MFIRKGKPACRIMKENQPPFYWQLVPF
uniref:Uncharacterized protein n=1 Tax=Arundo donax TaxID=35708 RepID=A0A0A9AQL3_ARUDO